MELVLFGPRHLVHRRRPHADGTNMFVHYYEIVTFIANTILLSISFANKTAHGHWQRTSIKYTNSAPNLAITVNGAVCYITIKFWTRCLVIRVLAPGSLVLKLLEHYV